MSVLVPRFASAVGLAIGMLVAAEAATGQIVDPATGGPSTPEASPAQRSTEPPAAVASEPAAARQTSDRSAAPRAITVVAAAGHPLLPLLRAELEALGLVVREVTPDAVDIDSDYRIVLTVAPIVDLRAGARLSEHLALLACGSVALPLRSASLRFSDREVARHGELFIIGGVGLQLTLP